jgi:hypothetical protein
VPASRSAKEICREDPTSISCKVATQREARKKKFEEQYAEEPAETEVEEAEETEVEEAEESEVEETETEDPKPATERLKYLDELEKAAGSK